LKEISSPSLMQVMTADGSPDQYIAVPFKGATPVNQNPIVDQCLVFYIRCGKLMTREVSLAEITSFGTSMLLNQWMEPAEIALEEWQTPPILPAKRKRRQSLRGPSPDASSACDNGQCVRQKSQLNAEVQKATKSLDMVCLLLTSLTL
jgi:hypothetical protein